MSSGPAHAPTCSGSSTGAGLDGTDCLSPIQPPRAFEHFGANGRHRLSHRRAASDSQWKAPAPRPFQHNRASSGNQSGPLSERNGPGHHFSHSRSRSEQNFGRVQKFSHSRHSSKDSNHSTSTVASTSSCISKSTLISHHTSSESLLRHYEMVRELGTGSFSRVALVRDGRATSAASGTEERVCKSVSTKGVHKTVVEWLKAEIDLLCSLDHPNIVKLYEYGEDRARDQLVLILEYIPGDTCVSLIERNGPMTEAFTARLIRQVLVAIAYLHGRGAVHRDLKLENVMLTRASTWNNPDCKLIDFGLGGHSSSSSITSGDFVGTPQYMAPEVVHRAVGDFSKVDVWAIGVCTYELLTGENLFGPTTWQAPKAEEIEEIYDKIDEYEQFQGFGSASCGPDASDFVASLLEWDARRRPSAAQSVNHLWLDKHKVESTGLTTAMLQSMTNYCSAHPLLRLCSFILACRAEIPDADKVGAAFLSLDTDGDGEISADDLHDVFTDSNWLGMGMDGETILIAADFDQSGGMSYTEFLAACAYRRHGSPLDIARLAFEALDDDRDGCVRLRDIQALVGEEEMYWLHTLPEYCNLEEWCLCIENSASSPCKLSSRPENAQILDSPLDSPTIAHLTAGISAIGNNLLDSVFGKWLCQANTGNTATSI